MPRRKTRIPKFATYEEEAAFWDTHSILDFEDAPRVVENVKVARPLAHHLSVRLDAKAIGELVQLGAEMGIGPSTLARIWIMQRLARERAQHARPPGGAAAPAEPSRTRSSG
jgi:hypothetical protein